MAISNVSSNNRPGVCTSTTRPTAPYEGQMIYETNTDKVLVWDGTQWEYISTPQVTEPGTWTSYTAWGIVQPGSVGGITYDYSKYTVINKTAIWNANVTFPSGTAGISGNLITISGLPIAAANAGSISGAWYYLESGVQHRTGTIHPASTTTFHLAFDGGGNFLGATSALKANDRLRFTCTWETV